MCVGQALEWGLMGGPSFVRSLVVMCCGANHHAWQIAISETQRQVPAHGDHVGMAMASAWRWSQHGEHAGMAIMAP